MGGYEREREREEGEFLMKDLFTWSKTNSSAVANVTDPCSD